MDKPKVICHMMSTIDGRILTANWGAAYKQLSLGELYEKVHTGFNADAWLCGRVTMEKDFTGGAEPVIKAGVHDATRLDFVGDRKVESFAIAVDEHGKLGWHNNEISGDHIITILSEKVADGYLAHLRDIGVSYIFAGKDKFDLGIALEKLKALFGIETIMLEGGGGLNGTMMEEGLVDEISLLIIPLVDGTVGSASSFDIHERKLPAHQLQLIKTEIMAYDVFWLHYKVKR